MDENICDNIKDSIMLLKSAMYDTVALLDYVVSLSYKITACYLNSYHIRSLYITLHYVILHCYYYYVYYDYYDYYYCYYYYITFVLVYY